MIPRQVYIRGAGDLASGVAHRLFMSGFKIVMLELPNPLVVRRTVSFASAVYENRTTVEDVEAVLCSGYEDIEAANNDHKIAVLIDPEATILRTFKPKILIDARMKKTASTGSLEDAELVIGLGPGFMAGENVHAVVETMRGPELGAVIYKGRAAKNTGIPGTVGGVGVDRLLTAPQSGIFKSFKEIGDLAKKDEIVAYVNKSAVRSRIDGLIRGLIYPGLEVREGLKIGDIDPRGNEVSVYRISDKARSVGGGVLEAILNRYHFDYISKV